MAQNLRYANYYLTNDSSDVKLLKAKYALAPAIL